MWGSAERDHQWIERIRGGDDIAFSELFAAYYPALCEFARSTAQSDEDAEEAASDVLFSVWEQGAATVPKDHLAAYLFAAVRNRVYMAIRTRERRRRREDSYSQALDADSVPDAAQPDSANEESDRLAAVHSAVLQLPDRCREIFILRWTAHLSYADIARTLEVSIKTVENQLTIAMKRIRDHLT